MLFFEPAWMSLVSMLKEPVENDGGTVYSVPIAVGVEGCAVDSSGRPLQSAAVFFFYI